MRDRTQQAIDTAIVRAGGLYSFLGAAADIRVRQIGISTWYAIAEVEKTHQYFSSSWCPSREQALAWGGKGDSLSRRWNELSLFVPSWAKHLYHWHPYHWHPYQLSTLRDLL